MKIYTEIIREKVPAAYNMSVLFEGGEYIMRRFMERWCAGIENPRIVEIGTHCGVSAAILSDYGSVDTFDIKADSKFNRVMSLLGTGKNIKRHVGDADKIHAMIEAAGPFDIAHIDGNHSYDAASADFGAVRGCSAILFHDYSPSGGGRSQKGVNRFIDELDLDIMEVMEPFAAVYPEKAGDG